MCFQDTDFSSLYELQFNGKRNSQQILKTFNIFYYEIVFQIVKPVSLLIVRDFITVVACIEK